MAPPSILPAWNHEAIACGLALEKYSQGHLSRSHGHVHSTLTAAVRRAQLLVIDEAHNFLRRSNRTHALYSNMADHVLLFTATPINRGPEDLLAIIDLLGADNLDDDTLKAVEQLWKRRRSSADHRHDPQREQLRRAIRQFTLRRTKTDLNRLVNGDPERYRLPATGRICRYPEHQAEGYALNETDQDRRIAAEVRNLASELRGLSRLTAPLELPAAFAMEGMSEESYLLQRLHSAAALARHGVAAALRSSRARLLEHLEGTASAVEATPTLQGLKLAAEKDGVLQRTRRVAGSPPPARLSTPIPEWLRDPQAHAVACEAECALYSQIAALARELSDAREREKVDLLVRLMGEQSLVLAFDSYLISLHDLDTRIRAHPEFRRSQEVIVATGDAASARKRLYAAFGPGSTAKNIIALCSDALSESVNLQAASTVVMLDTPSVIRVAEQRIGRVDRMNSAHDIVRALWPIDAPEFALKSSERLVERHRMVEEHLGSNLPLPASMTLAAGSAADDVVRYEDYVADIKRHEQEREARHDLQDAFAPVRALIEGRKALVQPSVYEMMRGTRERVLSSVGIVRSASPFCFMAVAGTDFGAPKWVYLETLTAVPTTDLEAICGALRNRFKDDPVDADFDATAAGVLEGMLRQLARHEEALLPRAKQRALHELRKICGKYLSGEQLDEERRAVIVAILRLAGTADSPGEADRGALASWWLKIVQPVRHWHLSNRKRRRPLLLKDLRTELVSAPLSTAQLRTVHDEQLVATPIERRVVATIIGVPAA
jgi:superfamily II DNA or RNA helicase